MIVASCPSCEKRFSKGDEVELRPVKKPSWNHLEFLPACPNCWSFLEEVRENE